MSMISRHTATPKQRSDLMNEATSLSSSLTLLSLIAPAKAMRRFRRVMKFDIGTNASLSLSFSSESKSCWIVPSPGKLTKLETPVPERRGLVGGGREGEGVLVRHRSLFGVEEGHGVVGSSDSFRRI
jgi:hypothetical protein